MENKEQFNDLIKTKIKGIPSDRLVTCYRLWLETGDVMSRHVVTISPDQTTVRAAQMMSDSNISCIVVVDKDSVAGILTETDFLMRLGGKDRTDLAKVKVAEIMSSPVETVSADMSVFDASLVMSDKHIKRLPILSEGRLAGIVTQTDLVRALTSYGMWREVAQIMTSDVAAVQKNITVAEAAKIMTERDISGIVAMEANKPVGILTERDLLRRVVALRKDPEKVKLQEVMSSPVITVPPSYSVFSVSKIMNKMHVRRLIIADDEYLCGIVTQTDIFRAVKKKLQEDEEENLKLLERSESSIYTTDLNGAIMYVNPAFMKLLEVNDSRQLVGQPFLPEKFWFDAQNCNRFLEGLKNRSLEIKDLTLKTSTGRRVDVTVFSTFTKNIRGQINGSQGILYDITAKTELVALKEAQDALRKSEEKYRSIFETAANVIISVDKEGIVIECNNRINEVLGFQRSEIIGRPMTRIIHPDCIAKSQESLTDVLAKGFSYNQEYKMVRKDGREIDVSVNSSALKDEKDKHIQTICIIADITARKQTERDMIQAKDQAERSHAEIEKVNTELKATYKKLMVASHQAGMAEVASDVLHNVGNVLNSVNVSATMISEKLINSEMSNLKKLADMVKLHTRDLETFLTKDPQGKHIPVYLAEVSRYLTDMRTEILEELRYLIKNIEHIKEIVKTQQSYAKAPVVEISARMDEVIEDAIQINQTDLDSNRIKVIREYSDFGNISIDRQKILQILVNLISNAESALADSSNEEKLLTIRFYKHNEDRIRIDMIDNGAGIPRENLTKIFQHGFTTSKDGHGFGLHSCALAAGAMGGSLTVHSDGCEQGATFRLELPFKPIEVAQYTS